MRRSAAPSQVQGNSFKKPKFIPPGRSNTSLNKEITKMGPDIKLFQGTGQSQNDPGVCSSNLWPMEGSTQAMDRGNRADPLHTVNSATEETIESKAQEEEPSSLLKYFSVVWCKASKKKHKKWEGDAILIVKGRSFTLKDLEGKDIGRGIGYKFKELENIEEGQTLVIGGKEIEILGTVSSDDFNSGKCFQGARGSPAVSSSQAARKCFSSPFKSVCQSSPSKENRQNAWQSCKPRHDPCAPSTPVQNDLQEFFALVDFVNPGVLGSLSSYRKIYEEPIIMSREPSSSKEEKELGERRAAELACLTGLFILRRTQEVINKYLPPKIENVIFCRPGALQIELYQKLLSSQSVRFCLQGLLENSTHLICIGALKKLCNHPCLLFSSVKGKELRSSCDENEERHLCRGLLTVLPAGYDPLQFSENESGKLQVLVQLLAAIHELRPTEKVVLVSNYRQTLNILEEVCKRHGYACSRLDGQTPVSQRQQIVDSFNSKYSTDFIFLLSSKAGGVGLNLIGGSHLILYDIDWNPATDIQAMSRVWRDGQKHPVHIYRLLTTGTIEEKIYQRQISKQGLSGAVVDLAKSSEHIQFSVEELKDLFTLHENSPCVTHDLLDCECTEETEHAGDAASDIPVTSRPCQLGPQHRKSSSLRPLSMSQLKQWKHFSGDHLNLTDPFLERIRENVSFFFQNITNQAPAI